MRFLSLVEAPSVRVQAEPKLETDAIRYQDLARSDRAGLLSAADHQKLAALAWAPVEAAETGNLDGTYVNAPAPGQPSTLTAAADGALPDVDDVSLVAGDRVLLVGQTNPAENGVYIVKDPGSASSPWVLERAPDAADDLAYAAGKVVQVRRGTAGSGKVYTLTSLKNSLGSTGITFGEYEIPKAATPNSVELTFKGNGTDTSFELAHNRNSAKILVSFYDASGAEVKFGLQRVGLDKIKVTCLEALPNNDTYYAVVSA